MIYTANQIKAREKERRERSKKDRSLVLKLNQTKSKQSKK